MSLLDEHKVKSQVEDETRWLQDGLTEIDIKIAEARLQQQHEYVDIQQTFDEI